jgi:glycosyltransferase involved in cell wall biosynthesis
LELFQMPTAILEESPSTSLERESDDSTRARKAVVVHAGARDSYQLAVALSEAGLLEALVTDLFWPSDRKWAQRISARLSPGLRELLTRRSKPGIPFNKVRLCLLDGIRTLILEKLPRIPLSVRRYAQRTADANLGRTAGKRARSNGAGLVSYSYYGFDAIKAYRGAAMLFQVHPHPATVRRLLSEELAAHPDCAASLTQEWELALPQRDYDHLIAETRMARCYLAASSFTRTTLIEQGASPDNITVIPYGVDLDHFHPLPRPQASRKARLNLLFVGRINQRKGVKYLLEALRLFDKQDVHLTICGRVVDDLEIFRPFGSQIDIRPSVSSRELVAAYQSADLFVFPSVAEGFGQVLLESLASGLPILSTTHTAAPDLIEDGVQGFVVEPRRPDLLAQRIHWALTHRRELAAMSIAARQRAEQFTWSRFRTRAAAAVQQYLATL